MASKLPPGITEWTPHPTTGRPRYLVRWRDPSGAPKKKVFDRLTDAKAHLASVTADKLRGVYVDAAGGRERFDVYAEKWAESQDWKRASRQRWPSRLAQITWALGDGVRLCDIDQLTVRAVKKKLTDRYAPNTTTGAMHLLGAILRSAVADGLLGRDPTAGVDAAPKRRGGDTRGQVTPDQVPSRSEALALLAGAPASWRAAVALGLAGLRIGEVLGMRVDRLALEERKVTVDAQAVELTGLGVVLETTKNERNRTIEVPQPVAVELRRHLRGEHGGTWIDSDGETHEMLFRRDDGKLWRHGGLYDGWAATLEGAKLPKLRFKFHALRHHCASSLLAEGCPLPIVAGYIGDTQETTMRVYSHWMPDDQSVPATILDRVLAPETDAPSARHGDGTDGR